MHNNHWHVGVWVPWVHPCVHACMQVCTCAHMFTRTEACVRSACVHVRACMCVHAWVAHGWFVWRQGDSAVDNHHANIYKHVYRHVSRHVYKHVYRHAYTHVYCAGISMVGLWVPDMLRARLKDGVKIHTNGKQRSTTAPDCSSTHGSSSSSSDNKECSSTALNHR